jgi:hypothetical protein
MQKQISRCSIAIRRRQSLRAGASVLAIAVSSVGALAAIGGPGGPNSTTSNSSYVIQTFILQTVQTTVNNYLTTITGNLVGRGIVFDQTIDFATGTPQFRAVSERIESFGDSQID